MLTGTAAKPSGEHPAVRRIAHAYQGMREVTPCRYPKGTSR